MKIFLYGWLFILLIVGIGLSRFGFSKTQREPMTTSQAASLPPSASAPASAKAAPVLIELFTSEGCSSCPPADALLSKLAQASSESTTELIALSEHVDYWNDLGWADPFSAPQYSTRQRSYAHALGQRGLRGDVYTPQMIVDGQFAFVGSRAEEARAAIKQAAALPKAQLQLTQTQAATAETVKLHLQVAEIPAAMATKQLEVVFALTENKLASSVTRGENSGRRLPHTAVARELRVLGVIAPQQKTFATDLKVKLDNHWQRSELRAVAFLQEQTERRICGATALKLN